MISRGRRRRRREGIRMSESSMDCSRPDFDGNEWIESSDSRLKRL